MPATADCTHGLCEVRVFDVIAALYVNAYQYQYQSIHNGRPSDGGGTIDDIIVGAAFTDSFDLETMVKNICYIYRIERQYKADGLYLYRNAGLDEPSAIAVVIDASELAVSDSTSNGVQYSIATTFLDSSNAVSKIAFNFLDADNDYKPNQLTAKSPDAVQTDPEQQITLPFILHTADAETLVNKLVTASRLQLIQHTFRLPPKYAYIGKGDVIIINHDGFSDTVRLTQTDFNADKSQSCTAVTVASGSDAIPQKQYDSQRTQIGGASVNSIPFFLDIPTPIPSEGIGDDIAGKFETYLSVAPAAAGNWLGAYLARQLTKDSEQYYTLFHVYGQSLPGAFIMSWSTPNVLKNKRWVTDSDTLRLTGGVIDWATANNTDKKTIDADPTRNLAVYGDHGRWEIIQFESILNGVMAGIVRGLRGTEWACGQHFAGDKVITLGPNLSIGRLDKSYIGSSAKYRGVSEQNQFILSDQVQAPPFVGNSRKPFAPYHFRGTRGQDGAITFTWLRRDRGGDGWKAALPMSESTLAYDVDVCTASGTVLRTTTVNAESFTYTPEMQSSDGTSGNTTYYLSIRQHGDVAMGFTGSEQVNV